MPLSSLVLTNNYKNGTRNCSFLSFVPFHPDTSRLSSFRLLVKPSALLATLLSFNVVTSSAVISFFAPCHRARELTWNQMLASQLSHSGKKKNEVAEGESEAEAYYFGVEAADTLMNPDRGRSPTQSYMHTSAHMIHAARLIAPPLFPLLSSPLLMACTFTVTHRGGISRCLISIIAVGGAESQQSTPAT